MIKRIINCDLDNLQELSQGEHSLEEVIHRAVRNCDHPNLINLGDSDHNDWKCPNCEGDEGYESAKDWSESEGGEK